MNSSRTGRSTGGTPGPSSPRRSSSSPKPDTQITIYFTHFRAHRYPFCKKHLPAGFFAFLIDCHMMASLCQYLCCFHPGNSGTDHHYPLRSFDMIQSSDAEQLFSPGGRVMYAYDTFLLCDKSAALRTCYTVPDGFGIYCDRIDAYVSIDEFSYKNKESSDD